MSGPEAQEWHRKRGRGLRRYLLRNALAATSPFLATGLLLLWLFRNQSLARDFLPWVIAVGVAISLALDVLFSIAWWFFQEGRYRRRLEAEARGELPRAVGV
jgi:hypothetical protein